jgi:predicted small integral membrane protein
MIPGGWMAWTFPVALFFWMIASLLVLFTILAIRFPGNPAQRHPADRDDARRPAVHHLLGSAFICLIWLFLRARPSGGPGRCALSTPRRCSAGSRTG